MTNRARIRSLARFVGIALAALSASVAHAQSATRIWETSCMSCHGEDAQGGSAPSLLEDQWLAPEKDRDFFEKVKHGVPNTAMTSFGETLSDAQIWAVVVHLRELQERARRQRIGVLKPDREGIYRTTHAGYKVERLVTRGLKDPWSVDFLPPAKDGTRPILITEKPGRLRVWQSGQLSEPVKNIPAVRDRGQGGLMDVAVHPEFEKNGWVYLSFSEPLKGARGEPAMTTIARGKLVNAGNAWSWDNIETIFRAPEATFQNGDLHYGCRIVFQKPDKPADKWIMFFAIGERGRMEFAQDLTRPNGKVFRVYDDGSIPADNPFVNQKDKGVLPQIWSYGHRNPQGLVIDLQGRLWDTEHGPRGGDELNLVAEGQNYGWPTVSFGINYNDSSFRVPWGDPAIVMPTLRWIPSIAACGLDVARGDAFKAWEGDLLAGGLAGQVVERLRIGTDGQVLEREEIVKNLGRVRDVVCGPDGLIYLALNGPDHVVRLVPAGGSNAQNAAPLRPNAQPTAQPNAKPAS
jgi:glucose/arabinose dehydrogenase